MEIEITKNIFFDPENHDYYEMVDGGKRSIPSVTDVINAFDVDGGKRFYTEESRDRGRIVHRTCFLDDEGMLVEESVPSWLQPYLDAYRLWKSDYQPVILNHEYSVYNRRLDICGTVDIVSQLPLSHSPKRRNHIDLKSGVPAASHILQLAGYCIIDDGNHWLSSGSYCLYLKNTGKYTFKEHMIDKRMAAGAEWVRMVNTFHEHRAELFGGEHA